MSGYLSGLSQREEPFAIHGSDKQEAGRGGEGRGQGRGKVPMQYKQANSGLLIKIGERYVLNNPTNL
jgi:hypothetical protein